MSAVVRSTDEAEVSLVSVSLYHYTLYHYITTHCITTHCITISLHTVHLYHYTLYNENLEGPFASIGPDLISASGVRDSGSRFAWGIRATAPRSHTRDQGFFRPRVRCRRMIHKAGPCPDLAVPFAGESPFADGFQAPG